MYREEILTTVHMAHYFGSAFTREETYCLLRIPAEKAGFEKSLRDLVEQGVIRLSGDTLYARDLQSLHLKRRQSSRRIFKRYRAYLKWLSWMPWVRFLALTGANAFESCQDKDDIDIFVITRRHRLWLTYLLMVLLSKATGQRERLCINYLVDEDHLRIPQESYFTAVQIVRMIPLLESSLGHKMLADNAWVFEFLPNAARKLRYRDEYLLGKGGNPTAASAPRNKLFDWMNHKVYRGYRKRLSRKYPDEFGRGIVLREGAAKLNRVNNQHIYEKIFRDIESEIAS